MALGPTSEIRPTPKDIISTAPPPRHPKDARRPQPVPNRRSLRRHSHPEIEYYRASCLRELGNRGSIWRALRREQESWCRDRQSLAQAMQCDATRCSDHSIEFYVLKVPTAGELGLATAPLSASSVDCLTNCGVKRA